MITFNACLHPFHSLSRFKSLGLELTIPFYVYEGR